MQQAFQPQDIHFADHPEFTPNLTPRQIFEQGAFGGSYWRKITSKVAKMIYEHQWVEFPDLVQMYQENPVKRQLLDSPFPDKRFNKYGVNAGSDLDEWESKGWIVAQDPYGWVQWYCRFFYGRRSADDSRQIDRWLKFAGPKGRFRRNLINQIIKAGVSYDSPAISPVIRQGLHQWGYCLVPQHVI